MNRLERAIELCKQTARSNDWSPNIDSIMINDFEVCFSLFDKNRIHLSLCKLSNWNDEYKVEERPNLSKIERDILDTLPLKYKYITRDSDNALMLFENKPKRSAVILPTAGEEVDCISVWDGDGLTDFTMFNHLFDFVTWEKEPYKIDYLLGMGDND